MSDIVGGEVFVDGEQVTGARLNNHASGAVIQPAFISGKGSAAAVTADSIVYLKGSALQRTTLGQVVGLGGAGTVTSAGLTLPADTFATTGSPVTSSGTIVATHKTQGIGEVHAAPITAAGVPTWRRLDVRDMQTDAVAIASSNIDWNLGNVFYKIVTTPTQALTMSNYVTGRTIDVLIGNTTGVGAGPVLTWSFGIIWPGGTQPVHTVGLSKWDWYRFTYLPVGIFGCRLAANLSV